ncbi:MAG: DUF4465 domain-containing protein [Chitinophagales bacterium]|nr:DUF4465 domain-containing protein [Chitinophagales bacterium]
MSITTKAGVSIVATFDTLTLAGTDTFYVNYSNPGYDVGFNDQLLHFQTVYDTAGYKGLRSGFVYSNMTDSTTSGYTNANSAKTGIGYNSSAQYAVAYASSPVLVEITDTSYNGSLFGFYVTNNTYAYNSIRDGDGFAKKFNNADKDWFKLTIKGYLGGSLKTDSVDFYLADFRHTDSTKDYILKTWGFVDLQPLGMVDSIQFSLTSSDVGSFGMNTPAYFCIDEFQIYHDLGVTNNTEHAIAKVYPNPATDRLYIETNDETVKTVAVYDMSGKQMAVYNAATKVEINTSNFATGTYVLQIVGDNGVATSRFVKR